MRIQEILKENDDDSNYFEERDWLENNLLANNSYMGWQKSKNGWSYAGTVGCKNLADLPIKLHRVDGFSVYSSTIKSTENFPDYAHSLYIENCNELQNFTHLPECHTIIIKKCKKLTNLSDQLLSHLNGPAHRLFIEDCPITDLIGLQNLKHEIKEVVLKQLCVEKGLLGLLLIPGLQQLEIDWITKGKLDLLEAVSIVSGYVGKPDLIYECQAKLIDAGLDRFAEI